MIYITTSPAVDHRAHDGYNDTHEEARTVSQQENKRTLTTAHRIGYS